MLDVRTSPFFHPFASSFRWIKNKWLEAAFDLQVVLWLETELPNQRGFPALGLDGGLQHPPDAWRSLDQSWWPKWAETCWNTEASPKFKFIESNFFRPSTCDEPWLTTDFPTVDIPNFMSNWGELVAQTHFKLMDVSFWTDASHWEARIVATGNSSDSVIGTVKQNISSYNSKWFLGTNILNVLFHLLKGIDEMCRSSSFMFLDAFVVAQVSQCLGMSIGDKTSGIGFQGRVLGLTVAGHSHISPNGLCFPVRFVANERPDPWLQSNHQFQCFRSMILLILSVLYCTGCFQNKDVYICHCSIALAFQDLLPNEVLSFMTLVYDVDETRQS